MGHTLPSQRPVLDADGGAADFIIALDSFVQSYYKVGSTTISIQNGPLAGQSVPHVHVHILPRRP